jgi:4-diphosphocytidyl-2-C-methyl-D-erythritol kinase
VGTAREERAFAHPTNFAKSEAALAPAKVNLTLRILGRRADGFHELQSLVAFAPFGDRLTFWPGAPFDLKVSGPMAAGAGPLTDNLVLRAVRALAERIDGLKLGRFALTKRLPSGAGLGGGSADAAAALRLIANVNHLGLDDPRIREAARATGADVPVCLDPRPRIMRGIGEILSAPMTLPKLGILVVHPGLAVPTGPVFKALGLAPGERFAAPAIGANLGCNSAANSSPPPCGEGAGVGVARGGIALPQLPDPPPQPSPSRNRVYAGFGHSIKASKSAMADFDWGEGVAAARPQLNLAPMREQAARDALLAWLGSERNDLESAAIAIAPPIADVLGVIAGLAGCRLARMSGSGSACFGLFDSARAAAAAARRLAAARPSWWVRAGLLGS